VAPGLSGAVIRKIFREEGMIRPGEVWKDEAGKVLQAHGGGVIKHNGRWYWYGEDKNADTSPPGKTMLEWIPVIGMHCYSSADLVSWRDEGLVLKAKAGHPDLDPKMVFERPKVLFNEKTGKFVMWCHADDDRYEKACTAVATADSPTGPFTYLGAFQPDGHDSRDFTVFKDDDGSAWLFHSSEWNKTLHVSRLTDDYLSTTGNCVRVFEGLSREAPVVFKEKGKYFMITSGCTGWEPNPAGWAVADSPSGPWRMMGNPCVGTPEQVATTFKAQAGFSIPLPGNRGEFILMLDRWNQHDLRDSRYLWLPMRVEGDEVTVVWKDTWEPML